MSLLSLFPAEVATWRQSLRQRILTIGTPSANGDTFESLALDLFQYQATHNPLYRRFLHHLNIRPESVATLRQIPFLPIGFFKNHTVLAAPPVDSETLAATLTFASSGTTQAAQTSHHYVPDSTLYDSISTRIFEQTYGPLHNVHLLALLPSYLERNNSSLVYMVRRFMQQTGSSLSGFFLNDYAALTDRLRHLTNQPDGRQVLLIGVTFGLLDWVEAERDLSFLRHTPNLIVMETGGMKGRRNELLREEVHDLLTRQLGVAAIHSEYGMTELLSQAYSPGNGVFRPSPTLRVLLRDVNDPFLLYPDGDLIRSVQPDQLPSRQTGGINVIDLANLDSCAFIETQDLGQYVGTDGHFRVIGRFDHSDIRGCNLLVV